MGYNNQSNIKQPCYQCPNRILGCHTNCEEYNAWKKELHNKKSEAMKQINPPMCRYFKQRTSSIASKSKYRYR